MMWDWILRVDLHSLKSSEKRSIFTEFSSERLAEILALFIFSLLPLPLSGIQSSSFDGLQIIKEFHIREECFGEATLKETEWMRVKLVFWRFAMMAFIVQTAYKQGYESHYQWSKLHPACMSKLTKA